jgi:hypothetical protein
MPRLSLYTAMVILLCIVLIGLLVYFMPFNYLYAPPAEIPVNERADYPDPVACALTEPLSNRYITDLPRHTIRPHQDGMSYPQMLV